jgi:hypothetical protein
MNQGEWLGSWSGEWFGQVGESDPNAMVGSASFRITASLSYTPAGFITGSASFSITTTGNLSSSQEQAVVGGGKSKKRDRIIIIEVDGKDYRVPESQVSEFLASIQTEAEEELELTPKELKAKVKHIGKAPVIEIKSAPQEMVTRLQQDFDYANAKINALFIKALEKYQQDLEDDEEVLLLLM